jgi:signal transduction histidine kinase
MDHIEALVAELRLVGVGLAHDLKSPITRLKIALERAIDVSGSPDARAALEGAIIEADKLQRMLATTLLISYAASGTSRERFTLVDVGALLNDLAEIHGPSAEEKGFSIEIFMASETKVLLHRDLVSQALSNLIENSINYAEGGSSIILSAVSYVDDIQIVVTDNGVGIPSHRYGDALRRYGRLDAARSLPGSGLGLSLVQAVAQLHGGDLELQTNAPGLRVVLKLRPAQKST